MELQTTTPEAAFRTTLSNVEEYGVPVKPRGLRVVEITDYQLIMHEPWMVPYEVPERQLKPFIGAIEALQLVGQVHTPELLLSGSTSFGRFMEEGILRGAYGPRIFGQLGDVVRALQTDPDTRQAVITIFRAGDLMSGSKDVPCTLTIQFFLRQEQLHMRVNMRSNDAWLGLPYDLIQFAALQGAVAAALDVPMGRYCHAVGSMHLYDTDRQYASYVYAWADRIREDYKPLWHISDIDIISSTARQILFGYDFEADTPFERWLEESISDAARKLEWKPEEKT